jgi:hypothetical protein
VNPALTAAEQVLLINEPKPPPLCMLIAELEGVTATLTVAARPLVLTTVNAEMTDAAVTHEPGNWRSHRIQKASQN